MGHSPCAWCWLLGTDECLYLPQTRCVCTCAWACAWITCFQTLSSTQWQVGDPQVWARVLGGQGVLAFERTCECWVHEGRVCECCKFASEHRAGPAGESGTMKQVRGLGSRQACWADREAVLVLEGSVSVHVLVNLQSLMCVCVSVVLLTLNTDHYILMTPNNTLMTVPNIPNTLKKFGFTEYQC